MKHAYKIKFLSLLLALLTVTPLFAACGQTQQQEETTTASSEATSSATEGTTETSATTEASTTEPTPAIPDDQIIIPFTAPAICANAGDTIDLLYYSVQMTASTTTPPDALTWSSDEVTIIDGKFDAPAKGVYKLTAKGENRNRTVYLVVKNKDETEYVLYQNDFADATAIKDWKTIQQTGGAKFAVADGKLTMDASDATSSYVRLMLPDFLNDFGDYRFEATGTITKMQNEKRYLALMFRIQKKDYPYYQMCVRQNATLSNGTEFAERTPDNKWNVTHTAAYSKSLAPKGDYTFTVDVHGNAVATSINGDRLIYTTTADKYTKGAPGLQVNGCCAVFTSVKVTLNGPIEATPTDLVTVREFNSNLNQTPTVVTYVNSAAELNAILTESPATAVLRINSSLDVVDANNNKITTVADALTKLNKQVIPAFFVETEATVKALCAYLEQEKIVDAFVMSGHSDLIRLARETYTPIRGIYDLSGKTNMGKIADIREMSNRIGSRIVVLPANMATQANVEALQRLFITVWVQSEKDTTVELISHITSGVNGIITQARKELERCFTAYFEKNTLTRVVNVIGHRGQPATGQENSIASSVEAYEAGATMVENDVYLSKDGVVVVMHDSTIDRTTNGSGRVEDMTVAQLQQYMIDGNANADKQPIPTLEDYFKEFKDKDIQIIIEIKTSNANVLAPMAELIKKYDMEDQVNFITFNHELIEACQKLLPGVSVGYLTSGITLSEDEPLVTVEKILEEVQKYNTTFNPSYASATLGQNVMTAAAHRGVTFWPWTINDRAYFDQYFLYGTNGITTNHSYYYSDYIKTIATEKDSYAVKVGSETALSLIRTNYDREQLQSNAGGMKIISGKEGGLTYQNGKLTAKEAGEYTVIFSHACKLSNGKTYYTYTQPVTITVNN